MRRATRKAGSTHARSGPRYGDPSGAGNHFVLARRVCLRSGAPARRAIPLSPPAAWRACLSVHTGPRGRNAGLYSHEPLVPRLPRPGREEQEAIRLAYESANPYSLAVALNMAAWLRQCRRESPLTHARAEAVLTLATEHGFAQRWAASTVPLGWARRAGTLRGRDRPDAAGSGGMASDGV
jgi:hypothetical protein